MSDELSFFDDAPESITTEAPSQEVTAPQNVQQPSITADQLADMQRRLDAAERWKQDLGRMFLGEQQQPDPNAALQQMLADPLAFQQQTAQTAMQQAMAQIQQETVMQDLRSKNPDIAAIEHLIDWQSVMNTAAQDFHQKNGRAPSFRESLETSAEMIRKNLQGSIQSSQTQQQGDAAKRMALNLDLSGGQPNTTGKPDPFKMSDSEWAKYRDSLSY